MTLANCDDSDLPWSARANLGFPAVIAEALVFNLEKANKNTSGCALKPLSFIFVPPLVGLPVYQI